MSFGVLRRIPHTLSFRLTLWYSGLFFLSTVLLFCVTYWVLARSLQQRDRKEIRSALTEYQEEYQREGVTGIEHEVAEKKSHPAERPLLLVRVATATNTTLFLNTSIRKIIVR